MIPREVLRKVRKIEIRSRRLVNEVFAGSYVSVFKGRGMEFDEVREYQIGDDVRAIDWNVTARMGHPYVKKYVEERELTVVLAADVSGSNRFGSLQQLKRDLIAELGAVLALSAIRNNDRVGLVLFTDRVEHHVPARKGSAHGVRVIRDLLAFQPAHLGSELQPALDFLHRGVRRRSVVFLLSDFLFDLPDLARFSATARHHDLIAVMVSDRREFAWPAVGLVEWEDCETARRMWVDTSDPRTRRLFGERAAARRDRWRQLFRKAGVDLIEVETGQPYERALVRFFRERERRLAVS